MATLRRLATMDEGEVRRQFVLDAPRVDVAVDGQRAVGEDAGALWGRLTAAFAARPRAALLAADLCTQTALVPFFASLREKLGEGVHLVDGGRQTVSIDTAAGALRLDKPFKVVDLGEDGNADARVLFVVMLKLHVNLLSAECRHEWLRTSVVERDWVVVEDDLGSEEDDLVEGVPATAADVAACADRRRHPIVHV